MITIKAALKDKASNTPIAVATPFPPLNFKKIGKQCPITDTIASNETSFMSKMDFAI
jgi:hypothetical protein